MQTNRLRQTDGAFSPAAPSTWAAARAAQVATLDVAQTAQTAQAAERGVGKAPDAFRLGPCDAVAKRDLGRLRAILADGEPFARPIARALRDIMGQSVTREGIEAVFSELWPAATWLLSDARAMGPGIGFDLGAVDRAGGLVLHARLATCRWSDGALELHCSGVHVDPSCRGLGLSAAFEKALEDVLRALSSHPNTRLVGTFTAVDDVNYGTPQATCGALVMSQRGYMFADQFGLRSPFQGNQPSPPGALSMARQFGVWLDQDPSLRSRERPLAEVRAELLAGAAACQQPLDFARLTVPGVTAMARGTDGRPTVCPVGRAFLLSDAVPPWCALRFVNSVPVKTEPYLGQLRAQSQVVCGVQLNAELERGHRRLQALTDQLWQDLRADPATRTAAYETLGRHGHRPVRRFLKARLRSHRLFEAVHGLRHEAAETDAAARQALKWAVQLMDGEGVAAGLYQAAQDPERPPWVRAAMLDRLESYRRAR